jgi:hypothetical protein
VEEVCGVDTEVVCVIDTLNDHYETLYKHAGVYGEMVMRSVVRMVMCEVI